MSRIRVARVYDPLPGSARRFLVDRVWPRGVRKEQLALDGWLRDVAPSPELRRWFGHDPERFEEFRRRYAAELDARPEAWWPLVEAARGGDVVLLYAARDPERNNAVVLRDYLLAQPAGSARRAPRVPSAGSRQAGRCRHTPETGEQDHGQHGSSAGVRPAHPGGT